MLAQSELKPLNILNSPPHDQTDQRQHDDDDGGHGRSHSHPQHLPVDLALRPIITAHAVAHLFAPVGIVVQARSPVVAVRIRTRQALAPGSHRLVRPRVPEPEPALAPERPEHVRTVGLIVAVVQLVRGALVHVLHAGHRPRRTVHVQGRVADVVVPPMDDPQQVPLNVPLELGSQRFGVFVQTHGVVHKHTLQTLRGRIRGVDSVDPGFHELVRKWCHRHSRVHLREGGRGKKRVKYNYLYSFFFSPVSLDMDWRSMVGVRVSA